MRPAAWPAHQGPTAMDFLSPEIGHLNLADYMRAALAEAEMAGQAGDVPIGAVVLIDGDIIARGRARHNSFEESIAACGTRRDA